jgi:hypothetical protein
LNFVHLSVLASKSFCGWPIGVVYGSNDSCWPKDLNQGRIFYNRIRRIARNYARVFQKPLETILDVMYVVIYWFLVNCFENTGVQSINDAFHIVVKVENVCVKKYIFNLNDNVESVVYALYSRILKFDYMF